MALGLTTESKPAGDILPIVKYSAQSGDFVRVDRFQTSDGTWDKSEAEISYPVKIAMDLENIEVGWISFEGGVPSLVMVKLGEAMPAKPTDKHSQGFRVRIGSKDLGLREFSHSAKTVTKVMDALHTQYEAEAKSNAGKMPIIEITGTERVVSSTPKGESVFKAPKWSITGWVDRPEMFDATQEEATPPEAEAAPATDDDPLFD